MQLLQDVFIVEKLQVLNEGTNKDTMRIRGVFGRCNEKNNNGRIYPTTVLENQLKKVQPLIQERRLCGELDHPSNDTVKLSNASHLITKLEIKGNELIGEAEILKTPAGLTAKALIDGGVRIGISSRGMGTLSEDAQGNKIVNEDYRLVTFDLVADPSTRGAFPSLAESTQSRFARESQSKLQKESNFVTMLRSKLREAYEPILEEKSCYTKPKKMKKKLQESEEELNPDLVNAYKNIANILINEAFADELERARQDRLQGQGTGGRPAQDQGGMFSNWRAERHARNMEIARARGAALGDVEAARIKDRAAQGKPVTKMDYAMAGTKAVGRGLGALGRGAFSIAKKGIQALRGKSSPQQPQNAPTNPQPQNAPQTGPTKGVKGKLTPQEIEARKNSPEAMAKKAARTQRDVDSGSDLSMLGKARGGIQAMRTARAEDQAGRFGAGGSVAKQFATAKENLPGLGAHNFKRAAQKAVQQSGRMNVNSSGKVVGQKIKDNKSYKRLGYLIAEALGFYSK